MTRDDLCWEPAAALARRIRTKQISPTEAVTAYLERIARIDGRLHSYLHVAADHALEAARAAEQAIADGRDLGPLHGVPVAVKDLFDTAGMPTTCGSPRILGGNVPARSATAVARLEGAGAVLLGKLHMTEFAFYSHHPDLPPPLNPWDAQRSPGGSSSGSAVAAVAGLAAATLGSDTIASIRLPSAWCGAVGLKPTWGRVSRAGVFPLAASLDHVGPITRTVEDAALILHCIAGPDPRDFSTRLQAPPPPTPAPRADFKGVRIGWDESFATMLMMPQVAAVATVARDRMVELGASVMEVELPDIATTMTGFADLFAAEMLAAHAGLYPARVADYGPTMRHGLGLMSRTDPLRHVQGAIDARAFCHRIDRLFDDVDVLLAPVNPVSAPPVGSDDDMIALMGDDHRNMLTIMRLTAFWDLAGTPALSLPWGFDEDGLPMAVQLVGRVGHDEVLLSIAARLEAEAPAPRRPSLE